MKKKLVGAGQYSQQLFARRLAGGVGDVGLAVNGTYTSLVREFAATECEFGAVGTFWIHTFVAASTTPSTGPPGLFLAAR